MRRSLPVNRILVLAIAGITAVILIRVLNENKNSGNIVFTLKSDTDVKYFKEFQEVFNRVLVKNPDYIYGKNNTSLDSQQKKRYNKYKNGLIPLLQAMIYEDIHLVSFNFDASEDPSLLKSKDKEVENFRTKISTEKEMKMTLAMTNKPLLSPAHVESNYYENIAAVFEKILKDPDILKSIPFSHKNIQNLRAISLASFKFDTLPNVFEVFESLESIFFEDTNVSDLEPLNEAKNIRIIYAENNKITAIEGLKDLTKLERLDLCGNKITKIDSSFVINHPGLYDNGITLSLKQGDRFPDEVQDVIDASEGKIKVHKDYA